ncbi:MAG: hypothetical protein JO039_22320 [Solirubrobacterales bacterium]|nr:hypothetical protein [Solirubrobacterales bacterium]
MRKNKHRALSFRLKLSKKLKTGTYRIVGRCGRGAFGSTRLKVVKALSQTPPPASLRLANNAYPCSHGSCWGSVSGYGLKPGAPWFLIDDDNGQTLESGVTDHNGNLSQPLDVPCSENGYLVADSTTAAGEVIESNGTFEPSDC